MLRASLVNIGDLTAYDLAKKHLIRTVGLKDGGTVHVGASLVAGFVGAALATPADVLKSRMMNQPTDGRGRGLHYKGILDCVAKSVKHEGPFSLYKGFLPCWVRLET